MKSAEEIMKILDAYDLTRSLRDAGELAGCSHHTVKHYVERRAAGGELGRAAARPQDAPNLYCTADALEEDWDGARPDETVVRQAWHAWRDEVTFAEQYVAQNKDLDTLGTRHGKPLPLRDILVHMIEEYARHCGHADLLRECIDGRIGQ